MRIVTKDNITLENLRREPYRTGKFGIVAKEVNKILEKYGFELIDTSPIGVFDMAYIDLSTYTLYDHPEKYPLELAIAIAEVNSMEVVIEGDEIVRVDVTEIDWDEEYHYQVFGWAEELYNIWSMAAKSSNISLKQVRTAITSGNGGAVAQVLRNMKTAPRVETVAISSTESFLTLCERLEEQGVEVFNLTINRQVPNQKVVTSTTYSLNPSKYANMRVRDSEK